MDSSTESSLPNQDQETLTVLRPQEGWHVLHLFYQIDRSHWSLMSEEERREAKTDFSRLVQEIRATAETQLLTFSMVSPKADLGLMLLTPDLHKLNEFEKQLSISFGAETLQAAYSYLSLTESSEYTTSREDYTASLSAERGLAAGSPELEEALQDFDQRMKKYGQDRLYPHLPDWPVFCFYNMFKRRSAEDNWYALDFATRKALMKGHAAVGRRWAGKIRQLITGSTGLDEAEWGVTLFAKDSFDVKAIVYEMRFDEVSARYAEFGDFYIGIQLPLDQLFRRLAL
ncbi:MAG: hydrogen peroxide-dependent heme synthase [Verrucomicrobiota bacterium]